MTFVKTIWANRVAPRLDADQLNRIEQGIADAHGGLASPPIVTALPENPVDKQVCHFLADPTRGVLWHLRYRDAEVGPYKWYYEGGASLFAEAAARVSRANFPVVTYTSIDATDPTVTLPLAGDYLALNKATLIPASACIVSIGVKVAATEPTVNVNADMAYSQATAPSSMSHTRYLAGLAAGTALAQRYYQNQIVMTVERVAASLTVTPIRVG